jgi:hypothetical protein
MVDDEMNEDELEENEVAFFKCKECGSRTLDVTWIIEITEICESELTCQCGAEINAAYLRERIVTQEQRTGFLEQDRHTRIEETETLDELDREVEDEQIVCKKCYKKYKDELHLWCVSETHVTKDREEDDLTITCNGCGREIEFGYSHPNKQGRIFLGADDTEFNPYKTFPDPKYLDKWKNRGWLRPKTPKPRRSRHSDGQDKE